MPAARVCSRPGCPNLTRGGRCATCAQQADAQRGSSTSRGYGPAHRHRFRPGVLTRDPVCVICRARPSVIADHYPLGRDELEARHLDPDDPAHGRGLCRSCDSRQTMSRQPGGWHRADR